MMANFCDSIEPFPIEFNSKVLEAALYIVYTSCISANCDDRYLALWSGRG